MTHALLPLFDQDQRIDIEYPGMHKEILPHVVRFTRPAPGMSFVLYSDLNETNADDVIQAQIAYFTGRDLPFDWKVYGHDTPTDLRDRLVAHGFEPEEPDAVMVLDLANAPPSLLVPVAADVRRLTEREQLADVIRVEGQVWGANFDWMWERVGGYLALPGYMSLYVAYVGDEPACCGWTFFHANGRFADLWGGSTVPQHRKRGLYTAVLATRVQEARQRGYRYLTIDASPMSRPIVERHGFRLLTRAQTFKWKGTDS